MANKENLSEWRGKPLVDRDGEKLAKLEDVYVDTDTDTTSSCSAPSRKG